ncbi:hypothetical protein BCD67_14885 [Oscillatoriales cyanobacterium USR001]|nr:hypothetical protein BCD67_14885 [Oscillatoriales cyanobacterium USR001]
MSFLRARGTIRPKISTMPRPKTEASMQLELYKLATEKQRIQQELRVLEQRKQLLQERLTVVNNEVSDVEQKVIELRRGLPNDMGQYLSPKRITGNKKVDTFYVEY